MSVYMRLNDEEFAPLAPAAQQIANLEALDFTVQADGPTWCAVRDIDGYRTSLTLTRELAMVSTIRAANGRVFAFDECASVDEAVAHAMDQALGVTQALLICDLIRADLRRAA